jgi:CBS-domain-containing membrane protein
VLEHCGRDAFVTALRAMRPSVAFSVLHSGLGIAALGVCAIAIGVPLLIPAVGASAYLVFSTPHAEEAAPRNMLVGHLLGASIGWAIVLAFGLQDAPGGLAASMNTARIAAAALAMATTTGVLRALRCSHPPAGASTMFVALGGITSAWHILDFVAAALVVAVHATLACRASSVAYPLWRARSEPSRG